MSNSTTIIDLISPSQAQKEVSANALFDAASPAMAFGRRAIGSVGLTWSYYGGTTLVSGVPTQVANGALTLAANATNYIQLSPSGVVSANTSGFTAGYTQLYTVIAGASSVTSYTDWRTSQQASTGVALGTANIFTKNQSVSPVALTDWATIAVDASLSNNFKLTLGGNRTLANPTNLTEGMVLNFALTQDGTGGRTLAYGNLYKFAGGIVPALSSVAGAKDFMSCYYDGAVLLCNVTKAYA